MGFPQGLFLLLPIFPRILDVGGRIPPVDPRTTAYLLLKTFHVIGASLWLGYWVFALLVKRALDRTWESASRSSFSSLLVRVDQKVLPPLILLVFASGYAIVRPLGFFGGRILTAPFAFWGLILFFTTVGIWWWGIRKLDHLLADESDRLHAENAIDSELYRNLSRRWEALVFINATLTLLAAVLMVFKFGS